MRPATAAAFHMQRFFIPTREEVNSLKNFDE
jgi:hypothetical protein